MLMVRILHSHPYDDMTELLSPAILFSPSLYNVKYRHTCEIEWIQGGKEHKNSVKTESMPGSKVAIYGICTHKRPAGLVTACVGTPF